MEERDLIRQGGVLVGFLRMGPLCWTRHSLAVMWATG